MQFVFSHFFIIIVLRLFSVYELLFLVQFGLLKPYNP